MSTTEPAELTLYFREGCHLCEDMENQLKELLEKGSYRLKSIDIDRESALKEQFDTRVPVLTLAGEELCQYFLDLEAVKSALASYNTLIGVNEGVSR